MKYISKPQSNIQIPYRPKLIKTKVPSNQEQIDLNLETVKKLYNSAIKKGLSHSQTIGLLGNIAIETGGSFNPIQRQYGGGPGKGLIQMEVNTPRYKHFINNVKNPNDLDEQYNYILDTIKNQSTDNSLINWGGYNRQDEFMKDPNLPIEKSTELLTNLYFRPGKPNISERQLAAKYIESKLNTKNQMNIKSWLPKIKTNQLLPKINNLKSGNKIYINPENKGKFTKTKNKTGKSTEELTHSKNSLTRKRAIFAQNAKKWHHKDGGSIDFLFSIINEFKKGGKLSKEYIKKARKKPGGSNVGKYDINQTFAGPSGGSPKGSYPIGNIKYAKSALKLAHNAPNPSGIKNAVYKKYPQLKKYKDGGIINYDISKILNKWKKQ